MKKIFVSLMIAASALSAAAAVAAPQSAHEDLTPVAGTFSRFNYDGFTMLVPSGTLISKLLRPVPKPHCSYVRA